MEGVLALLSSLLSFTYLLETYPVLFWYLTLYQPDMDLSIISIVVFLGIVVIILEEVEASFLKLRLSVVTPFSEEVDGVLVVLSLFVELLLFIFKQV